MHSLSYIDYAIIIGYLGVSLIMGLIMTRKAGSSLDNYFLGGHSLPWWLLGVAGMANWFDLTGTMIITSFLYMMGPRGLFVEFRGGAVLILAFLLCYAGKWHRRSHCMTGAEWMTYRFGEGRAAEGLRLLSAVMAVISTVMLLAYLIRGTSLFFGMFFPFPPMATTLVVMALTTLYTVSSGFYGVVLTDLVQGVIVIFSCVVISVMAWHMVPGAASLAATASLVTGNSDWIHSYPAWHTPMPAGYEQYEPLIVIASFYLLRNVLCGMGSGAEPRYFGAKSDRDCGLQSLLQGIMVMFRWPLMIGFAIMGIYLVHSAFPHTEVTHQVAALVHARYPGTTAPFWNDLTADIVHAPSRYPPDLISGLQSILGPDWRGKLPLVGFNGTINPERILPAVLLNDLPTGLKGVVVVAMFAAMMSCKNGLVNGASAFMVKDIYQNFLRPRAATRELILASYASTIGIVALAFYFGVTATSINDLWGWIIMGFGAGGLAPAMLRFYWWRCNAWGMFGGILAGGVGAILQRIFIPQMPEWEQFVIMTILSFAGTIGISLVTAPTPMERLRHFYRTTRPFGLWAPLRGEFQGEARAAVDRENRNDILAVPFTLLWQVTMFLLPMQLVIKSYAAFLWTLPLFLIACAGMYVFWWKPLPPHSDQQEPEPFAPVGSLENSQTREMPAWTMTPDN
ncbi:MAG: sodium:solute symporter [Chthoniobacteraceae bacterium]|jgi:Na+/proline symporter